MGEIRTTGADAERVPAADPLQRRHQDRRERRPVLGALPGGRRRARRPVHLPPRRATALPDRHQRVEPREGPRLVPGAGRGLRRRRQVHDAHADYAMLALQGPDARAILRELLEGEEPKRMRWTIATVAGVRRGAGLRHRLHRRGRRRAADPARRRARGLGRAAGRGRDARRPRRARHAAPRGLLPPVRQRPVRDRNPIEAGLGWGCKLDTGFIGSDVLRDVEPSRRSSPFAFTGPGIPRQGNAVLIDGRAWARSRAARMSPCLEIGIGMAYVPARRGRAGHPDRGRRARQARAPAEVRKKPLYEKES